MGKQLFKSLMILGIFLTCSFTMAQKTITGTVSDADGPLPGATIVVQGTTFGVTTDFDGIYSIEANEGDVLEFSFIGMETASATIGADAVINITLEGGANQLEEVVVVGYSSQTRGDITGSVASVDMDEALKVPVANASEALQGRVTGVTVTSSASPGAAPKIAIRGFGTGNNTDPLFIIDGVQTTDANILNSINPADIAQMNVLKDGAAAIYGARASNGVIIVTTKSGGYNQDKATLTLDMWTGMAQAANLPKNLNIQQHADMRWQSFNNDGVAPSDPQYGNGATPVIPATVQAIPVTATVPSVGTRWAEEVTQSAPTSNISLSMSNGTDTGKYYMSLNYYSADGIVKYTGFERISTALNSEFKIADKVRVGEHLNVAWTDGNGGSNITMEMANRTSPLLPVYDDDGNFVGPYSNTTGLGNGENPLAVLFRGQDDFNKSLRVFGDIYVEADLYDGLTFKSSLGMSIQHFDRRGFQAFDPEAAETIQNNTLTVEDLSGYEWTWSNTLMYNKSFGEHNINAVIGVEAVEGGGNGKIITRNDYLFEDPDFYNLATGTGTPNVSSAYEFKNTLFSYFLSVNYNYKSKYFASVTLRNDKSSRFQGDNKSQTFPSVSAGWLMSKEDWFSTDVVSRVKVKASYGELGNQQIPGSNPTLNISNLSQDFGDYAIDGTNIATGAILSSFGNPDLKWETSVSINAGLEFGFFSDKLTASFEWYTITTNDLIAQDFSLISTTAIDAAAPYVNLGEIKNTGYDISIGYNNTWDNGFTFGVLANFSHYKNEVVDLISAFQTGRSDLRGGAMTRTEVGREISEFYGRNVIGYTDDGRFEYEDVNGDGTINDDDRKYIGSPHPDLTYGVNFNFAYKGFDASVFFTGSQGNDIYNYQKIYSDFPTFTEGNRSTRVLDSWTPDNTNASLPALSNSITNAETNPNSFFVEDGSYFRLKNLQLGYSFPTGIAEKMAMESLRIYVVGTNLFTSTNYDGIDPEVVAFDNLTLGVDNDLYPRSKIYTIGVTFKF